MRKRQHGGEDWRKAEGLRQPTPDREVMVIPTSFPPDRLAAPRKPTPEMLRAAAAAHLSGQGITLWGRAFDLINEPIDPAADWLAEQVACVLAELST